MNYDFGELRNSAFGPVSFLCAAEVAAGSAAWLGRGLSCVCVQGREGDSRPSFDLTPASSMAKFVKMINACDFL